MSRPRTVLMCHHDAPLHYDGIARWMASWSDLRGIVVVEEPRRMLRKRLLREAKRIGWFRILDVVGFRLWYRLTMASTDAIWLTGQLNRLRQRFTPLTGVPVLRVSSANSPECQAFLADTQPEMMIALVKSMLAERIFTIPTVGTFVLHPGICPEYRNSHGCFWALASDDVNTVGMSMLRIDRGVDTGPIFGYFRTAFDEVSDSHIRIQNAMVLDNLSEIADRLGQVAAGIAKPVPIEGRASRAWGQPWLTAYLRWKRHARRRLNASLHT